MRLITNWDPFRELDSFQNRLASLFGQEPAKLHNHAASPAASKALATENWRPLVDIVEDDNEFVITAEIPQVRKEDVKVTVEDGILVISGERKTEKEVKEKKLHRIERSYGSFQRSFVLTDNVDASQVKAEHKDGLLKVHLPKSAPIEKKSIEVKVS